MRFESIDEYDKDLKRLLKKYRTLESDMDSVKEVLAVRPNASPPSSFQIEGLGITTCVINEKDNEDRVRIKNNFK